MLRMRDQRKSAPLGPWRYLIGFIPVVTIGARALFTGAGITGTELRRLEDACTRAVQLYITLWSRPYAKDGLW